MSLLQKSLIVLAVIAFGASLWFFLYSKDDKTLDAFLAPYDRAGTAMKQDLSSIASLPISEDQDAYSMEDTGRQGIDIRYANVAEASAPDRADQSGKPEQTPLTVSFPKDQSKPIEVKLDDRRSITIQDGKNQGLKPTVLTDTVNQNQSQDPTQQNAPWYQDLFTKLSPQKDSVPKTYLAYQGDRKTILYSFKKDQATDEKKLKSWTLYRTGNGIEQEAYRIDHAQVRINEDGHAELFYQGDQELKNEAAKGEVEPSLLERAQRTLEKEMGEDILNSNQTPDLIIPKPFFYDQDGERHESEWAWDQESKTLSLELTFSDALYPIALDPTLQFTAPATSNTGDVITGEASSSFGSAMASGDFNADGKTDLVVGTFGGDVYIFYNDGGMPTAARYADVVIAKTGSEFGRFVAAGDWNVDGRMDLAVGAYTKTYLFYNDGTMPTAAVNADVIITGVDYFGASFAAGDWNADGKTDLVVGDIYHSTYTGRAYIFYADGTNNFGTAVCSGAPSACSAANADVIITGEATNNNFGNSFSVGDFNADGRIDLAVGAYGYSTNTGRAYIFYNDGSIPTAAASADVIITGEAASSNFGISLSAADFNTDGKIDLIVGSSEYNSAQGRVYIFYNDGSIPTAAASADVIITGGSTLMDFGCSLAAGDMNADGKTDLIAGSYCFNASAGRAYIFYNDGSIPTAAASADVIITGEAASDRFSMSLEVGDWNSDGKTDLAIGAKGYSSLVGRAYILYSQNGQVNTNRAITGESGSNFSYSLAAGDLNADSRIDLIVGARSYSAATGRAYIFYNDGSIPTTAATADVIITGEGATDRFGQSLITGDFNADGKVDLAVGAYSYSGGAGTGRAYIFYNDGSIPTAAASADVIITGESTSSFGWSMTSGDFNADSRIDLTVSAYQYSTFTGRAYIFYNDGSIPTTAATADVIITGNASNDQFGQSLATSDLNADSRVDLIVGADGYSTSTGRAYIFYNDGSIPTTAATADVTITGEASSGFGIALTTGDFNADGKTDFVVGANQYSSSTGRVYIFYNDGSIPTTAATADVTMTGEATNNAFGSSLASGDFNADGWIDLAVGAYQYSTSTGRAYIFYNDGSIPTTAATADVIITGETTSNEFGYKLVAGDFNADSRTDVVVGAQSISSGVGKIYFYETRENFAWKLQSVPLTAPFRTQTGSGAGEEISITGQSASNQFGYAITTGDFNADGKTDLAVGASGYSSSTGRTYIFYNDGSLSPSASSADVIITGETTNNSFGITMTSGDFNADGKTDLAVGASGYSTSTGRAYIFYNDGSIPTTAATADVTITGETTSNVFGSSLTSGDFNADGKTDLAVGASGYSTSTGRAYIFYNDGSIPTTAATADVTITGNAASDLFGVSLVSGDFNFDSKTDLAIGAYQYSSSTGRAYIFYNDGSIPTTAGTADVTITGGATSNSFGSALAAGDFNADGKTDLAIGAYQYSSSTGRAYIFYNDGSIPTTAGTADVTITGGATSNSFGSALAAGDFNADGKTDLAIGAYQYSSSTGRAYIFYNDGSIPTTAATADVIITGEATGDRFGTSLASGDLNADGKTDLVVGASSSASNKGKAYLYTWNDAIITGEAVGNHLGATVATGDLNADGKTDLAVGAWGYSSNTGRVYVFYQDNIYPSSAASADVIITGAATGNYFGSVIKIGDVNADGKADLVTGTETIASVYIFYNDGSYTSGAATADVIISGSYIGFGLAIEDMNADGKTDLISNAFSFSYEGYAAIFYADGTNNFGSAACTGSAPTTCSAANADVIVSGTGSRRIATVATGDVNTDGRPDLLMGGTNGTSGTVYILYNDGVSFGTVACTTACSVTNADASITGENNGDQLGYSIAVEDFNLDGRMDIVTGASQYASSIGRIYIFYQDGSWPATASGADVAIAGQGGYFGGRIVTGDMNADGRADIVAGASYYTSRTGRAYIFYNDGSIPTMAAAADTIIDGVAANEYLASSIAIGDMNADGKQDIVVGSEGDAGSAGWARIITTEAKIGPQAGVRARGTTKIRGNFIMKR